MNRRKHTSLIALLTLLLVSTGLFACGGDDPTTDARPASGDVFISLDQLNLLVDDGAAVIDVRREEGFLDGHIPGAANAHWTAFVDGAGTGRISDDDAKLTGLLRDLGVRNDAPVVLYGLWGNDGEGGVWGDEGRIYWNLRYLGHSEVYILDGGLSAWTASGQSLSTEPATIAAGDATIARRAEVRATREEILTLLDEDPASVVILDTRELAEFEGAQNFGEERGGHISGAKHLWFYEVFDADGALRSDAELTALFGDLGITNDTTVVAYCTAGIRSGFLFAVLEYLGYTGARNYDGSIWEWAADPDAPMD